jgi:hypothetical protein
VSGLSDGGNLWYEFVLTGQVSGNPASTNQLNVVFPVPVDGNDGGTVTILIPALGNSTSVTYVTAQGGYLLENELRATEIWKCIQNRLSPLSRYWWAFLLRVRQRLQLDQLQPHQKRVQQLRKVLAAIG